MSLNLCPTKCAMVGSSVSMDWIQVVHPVQLFSDTKMTASNENTNIDFMPRIACVWLIPNTFREISLAVIFCSGMEAARTGKGRIGDETFDPLLWVSVLEFEYVFFPIVHCRYTAGLKLVVSITKVCLQSRWNLSTHRYKETCRRL